MSSGTILGIDRATAATVDEFAPAIFEALHSLNAAEPIEDAEARRAQLRALLEEQLRALGRHLQGLRDGESKVFRENLRANFAAEETEAAVARAVGEYLGRIGLAVTQHANRPVPTPPAVVHSPVFHGAGVNYQVGDHNQAAVHQTIVQPVAVDELRAAIDELIRAVQQSQGATPDQRAETVDLLEQVKAEAAKDKPNKLKLTGLLSGVGGTLQAIAAAPEAWTTVCNWVEFIKQAATS